MRAVLISIQPKWCELIASGKKTIEIRKTRPKLETPFKVYIYETLGEKIKLSNCVKGTINRGIGKVIGEFICKKIDRISHCGTCNNDIRLRVADINFNYKELDYRYLNKCQVSYLDVEKYSNGGNVFGWHISNLVIYDKPRELSEFRRPCENDLYCESCAMYSEFEKRCYNEALQVTKPPQSWCYVESEVTE